MRSKSDTSCLTGLYGSFGDIRHSIKAFYAAILIVVSILLVGCSLPKGTITPPPARDIHPSPQAAERLRMQVASLEGADAPTTLLVTEEELNAYLRENPSPLSGVSIWFTRNRIFLSSEVRFFGKHRFEAWATAEADQGALHITFTEAAWDGRMLSSFWLRALSGAAQAALEDARLPFDIERITLNEGMMLLEIQGKRTL